MYYTNTLDNIEKGYKWLETEVLAELEPSALNKKIVEEKQKNYNPWSEESIEVLNIKLKGKYHSSDILPFFTLGCCNINIATEFRKASESDDFWTNLGADSMFHGTEGGLHIAYHFHEFGISSNRNFVEVFSNCKKEQTVEGTI